MKEIEKEEDSEESQEERKDLLAEELLLITKNEDAISKLNRIEVAFTPLDSLANLQLCHNLQEMTLIGTGIASLKGIECAAHSLDTLCVIGCRLAEIESCVGELIRLKRLCLQENQIVKIENLSRCVHLQQLWLFGNKILQIEGLDLCIILKEVNLAENRIKKVSGISRLVNLQRLELSGNPISILSNIDEICELPMLEELSFASPMYDICPITEMSNYKSYILANITSPSFGMLDNEKIVTEAISSAHAEYVQLLGKMNTQIEEVESAHLSTLLQLDSQSKENEDELDILKEKCISQLENLKETIVTGKEKIEAEHVRLQDIRSKSEATLKEDLQDILAQYTKEINSMIREEEQCLAEEEGEWDLLIEEAKFEKDVSELLIDLMFSSEGAFSFAEAQSDSPDYLFIHDMISAAQNGRPIKLIGANLIYKKDAPALPPSLLFFTLRVIGCTFWCFMFAPLELVQRMIPKS